MTTLDNIRSMTETEKLILKAMLTRSYFYGTSGDKVVRPGEEILRITFEGGVRDGDFRRFISHGTDMSQPLEWATLVANFLTEDRVKLPKRAATCESWDAVIAEVKRLVNEQFESDKAEAQADLEEDPEWFATGRRDCVVVEGKVTDPWGPALSGPVMWWLDNMTLVGVWLVYQVCRNAATDAVNEGLISWTLDPSESTDPRKAAHEAFESGLKQLDKDIRALLAG